MSTSIIPVDKFAPFVVSTQVYKTVDEHPIHLDILIPKKLIEAGTSSEEWKAKRPVMLFFHAGGLIGGGRDFQPWWSQWILDLIVKNGAIAISADYRLIPEATCEDVLDDLHDACEWVANNLTGTIQNVYTGLQPDLSKILLAGTSAGGYCTIQLGLSYFNSETNTAALAKPRAVIAAYPYISLRTPHWTQAYTKNIWGIPQLPTSIVDDHLAAIVTARKETGKQPILTNAPLVTLSGEFKDRGFFAICAEQHGRILGLFGPERDSTPGKRRVHPEDRIADGRVLPPLMIVQGTDDSISPVEGADLFVEHIRKHKAVDGLSSEGDEIDVLRYYRVPGEHLFEAEMGLDGDKWVKDGAAFIEKHWL